MPNTFSLPSLRATASAALFAFGAAEAAEERVAVKVDKADQRIAIDVVAHADAPLAQAWAVFTDYEGMPAFLKNVSHSTVVKRDGNTVVVEQAGATTIAFMRFGFRAVRSVELVPMREIRSTQVSGDFKEFASTTTFTATERGTRIHHRGNYVPKAWLPPLIGTAVIESETRKQYVQFLAEVERRAAQHRGSHAPAALPHGAPPYSPPTEARPPP